MILVDTNVLFDLVLEAEVWADWFQHQLETACARVMAIVAHAW